jgi:hypothetical protein
VEFKDRREGMGLQDQLATLYKERVLPLLDTILSDFDLEGHTIQIEEIALDLGTLSSKNWEQELVERSVQQFKSALQRKLLTTWPRPVGQASTSFAAADVTIEGVQWLPEAVFHYTRLLQFLRTGSLPVSNSKTSLPETFMVLLNKKGAWQISSNREALLQLLLTDQQALERLIRQCGELAEEIMYWLYERPLYELSFYHPLSGISDLVFRRSLQYSLALIRMAQAGQGLPTAPSAQAGQVQDREALAMTAPFKLLSTLLPARVDAVIRQVVINELGSLAAILLETSIDNAALSAPGTRREGISNEESPRKTTGERKDNKKEQPTDPAVTTFHIQNAGLVILQPFLGTYFTHLGLLNKKQQWVSRAAQQRAVLLSQYLVTGEEKIPEYFLPLNKLFCGYALSSTLDDELVLTGSEKEESISLLNAVIANWGALKNTGIDALRVSFLQRAGKLMHTERGWQLLVAQKSYDILMQSLPWTISRIKTPWMEEWLLVDWV